MIRTGGEGNVIAAAVVHIARQGALVKPRESQ